MMNNIQQIVQGLANSNPKIAQNQMFQAVLNNDQAKGVEIANNLCNTYGVTKEQAMQQALAWANSDPRMRGLVQALGLSSTNR